MFCRCAANSPCEKFSRATFMPARIICSRTGANSTPGRWSRRSWFCWTTTLWPRRASRRRSPSGEPSLSGPISISRYGPQSATGIGRSFSPFAMTSTFMNSPPAGTVPRSARPEALRNVGGPLPPNAHTGPVLPPACKRSLQLRSRDPPCVRDHLTAKCGPGEGNAQSGPEDRGATKFSCD